ncbi:type II secretion system protein [Synechococcus sp. WH 8101]|uniref:type II secretion system protein n=1 Tax=Synechococcus sp. WH 8101 TaxID=59932 RepID=UPI00164C0380|nr:type II secretion system protein [Synechococcus sp. WH 8101]
MIRRPRWHQRTVRLSMQSGFTLVEVLIAAVVMSAMMAAVGRLTVAALATGRLQGERTRIEAAVSENIQLIQKAESEFRFDAPNPADQPSSTACSDPSAALKAYIETRSSASTDPSRSLRLRLPDVSRTMRSADTADTLVISYGFEAPERSIGREYRVLELNPNFQALCP